MNLIPICIPPKWSKTKDLEHFEQCWVTEKPRLMFLIHMLTDKSEALEAQLDLAVLYFGKGDTRQALINSRLLSIANRIYALLSETQAGSQSEPYRERLAQVLSACLWVNQERERIIRELYTAPEQAWLYSLKRARSISNLRNG